MSTLLRGFDLVLTMDADGGEGPLGAIEGGSIVVDNGRIAWVGDADSAPAADEAIEFSGGIGMPALVDCHTHAVWDGSRADEWRRRLAGEDYSAILEAGGGILSTVRDTRAAPLATLTEGARQRLAAMRQKGVGTVEVKSGYGLSVEAERKCLQAAKAAGDLAYVRVLTTFLGAHTVPAEHRGNRTAYVDEVIERQLPAVRDVADFIDVYVDRGAFTVDEGRRILQAGKDAGLGVRIHAEQVQFTGAAAMAAELGALSADHLERIDDAGIEALAASGTVAVMLPGAMLYLRDPAPPTAKLRAAGVPMAVATDLNPGTSPVDDLWTCATLSCLTMGLTVEETLRGITVEAARALGRSDLGILKTGAIADVIRVVARPGWRLDPAALIQPMGAPHVRWAHTA